SYRFWPDSVQGWSLETVAFGLWLVLVVGFVTLTVYDLRWMILPDRVVFTLLPVAVGLVLVKFVASGAEWGVITGALAGVLGSAGVVYMLFQISGGKWIGGGDVKTGGRRE
ncbi:MAG: prepilin peptidase, partial [Elusimicrobiota bacterium]